MRQFAILICESVRYMSRGWDFLLVCRTHPEKHQVLHSAIWGKATTCYFHHIQHGLVQKCIEFGHHKSAWIPTTSNNNYQTQSFPWLCSLSTHVWEDPETIASQGTISARNSWRIRLGGAAARCNCCHHLAPRDHSSFNGGWKSQRYAARAKTWSPLGIKPEEWSRMAIQLVFLVGQLCFYIVWLQFSWLQVKSLETPQWKPNSWTKLITRLITSRGTTPATRNSCRNWGPSAISIHFMVSNEQDSRGSIVQAE